MLLLRTTTTTLTTITTHSILSPPKLLSLSFRLISTTTTSPSLTLPKATTLLSSYGPTLRKGTPPPQLNPSQENDETDPPIFEKSQFTRTYSISALRVPADLCSDLERRIRGHLLNWPRVRNVARVPGDDIDEDVRDLIVGKSGEEEGRVRGLERRGEGDGKEDGERFSGVLLRDRLVKDFNARGFMRFKNLARISRPNSRKKKERKEEGRSGSESEGEREGKGDGEGEKRKWRRKGSVLVEVVEEGEGEGEGSEGELSGLLGEEYKVRKWRGSTRLLLLDERYVGRSVEELPEAIKVALNEGSNFGTKHNFELVRCNLTLFYDYWSMNEILEALLPENMIIPSAFETVGHIAHLNLKDEHLPYKKIIAKVVLDKNRPKIQTVVNKIEAISNNYRTMQLEVLSGNHSLVTTVIENGIRFHVDLATVYWNSRLATERQRLLSCFTSDDVLCDVFSGVGPITVAAAKKVKRVYANDLNPYAVDYLERNCVLNKLDRKVKIFNMDGRRFIDAMFSSDKDHCITQVVMNLPKDAVEFLDTFRGIFRGKTKDQGFTLPKIHVYGFSKAEDPEFDFHERIRVALAEAAVCVDVRRVRLVAPGKWMLCASFVLPEKVAFSKNYVDYG